MKTEPGLLMEITGNTIHRDRHLGWACSVGG